MKKIFFGVTISLLLVMGINFILDDNKSIVTKKVNYNGNSLLVSIDGKSSDTLPTSGTYYLASYDCQNSNTILKWDSINYELEISNGNKKSGIACNLEFESNPKISDMEVGSYVKYVGNNGCEGKACNGENINYVSDTDMGYCFSSDYKFVANGFRIAYVKYGTAYLVSAGSPECMCTDDEGKVSDSSCNGSNLKAHLSNLNSVALKYCNKDYVYGGVCDENSAWAMGDEDYYNMVGRTLATCYGALGNSNCGYNNNLIDNGSYYWLASVDEVVSNVFRWYPNSRGIDASVTSNVMGVRPIIRLNSNVIVTGGSGTYDNPYTIKNES